jgi:hypothetical protein
MKFLYSTVVSIGPAVLLLGLVMIMVHFLNWRSAPEPKKKQLSGWRYLFLCLGAGVPAFVAGTAAGIWLACSSPDSGNLCGLVGVFCLGPLIAGVAIWSCAYFLTRAPK